MNNLHTINQLKNHNILLVKKTLIALGDSTKNEIAQATKLSVATCGTILNELAESGEILEVSGDLPTFGRPPKTYRFNAEYTYICCLFLSRAEGKKEIHCAVMNLLGDFIYEEIKKYETLSMEVITEHIQTLVARYPKISTLSIGTPGYYYNHKITSSSIPELEGHDILKELKQSFDFDMFIENDMNAMSFGIYYYRSDIVKPNQNMALISIMKPDHYGAASIINGKILHGASAFAGEVQALYYPGEPPKAQLAKDMDGVIQVVSIAAQAFISIINPHVLVFTGSRISEDILPDIRKNLLKYIPEEHLPRMVYKSNFSRHYMQGLCAIAVQNRQNSEINIK